MVYSEEERKQYLTEFKKNRKKGLSFNESIKAMKPSAATFRKWLKKTDKYHAVKNNNTPFTAELRNGGSQIKPYFFDLRALDYYYSDPRYTFIFQDYYGSISLSDKYYMDKDFPKEDDVFIQYFGLGYNKSKERVIVVILAYLADLPPKHQRIWIEHLIDEECTINKTYYDNTVLGKFSETGSVNQALCSEQVIINDICRKLNRNPLFNNTFEHNRPKELSCFIRPTKKNYYEFITTLEKITVSNINKKFFLIPNSKEYEIPDFEIEGKQKSKRNIGTLLMLKKWIKKKIPAERSEFYDFVMKPLFDLRDKRQIPAHEIFEDEYNEKYYDEQSNILDNVYNSIRYIRKIVNSLLEAPIEIPDWINECKIMKY